MSASFTKTQTKNMGVTWKRGNSVLKFASADSEIARKLVEKYSKKK